MVMSDSTDEDVSNVEEVRAQGDESQYNNTASTSGNTIDSVSNTSQLLQPILNDIQMTLKNLNENLAENAASIKRVEKSIPALYDRIDKTINDELPKMLKKIRKEKKIKTS
jgi:gas vesicle protein